MPNNNMKKLSKNIEDQIFELAKKSMSPKAVAKKLYISQYIVIRVLKRPFNHPGGRRKLLTAGDARLMMRRMKADILFTPKEVLADGEQEEYFNILVT